MTAQDLAAIVKGVAPAVLQVVSSAVAPLNIKIASLEAQLASVRDGRDGKDGKDAVVDLDALARAAAALIPVPRDGVDAKGEPGPPGKDADPVDLDALALKAAELIPSPKDGTSVTLDDLSPLVSELVQKAVAEIPQAKDGEDGAPGAPGQSVDPADVEAMVVKAVSALPAPKDGLSVTVEDVAPLVAQEVEKAVKALPVPKDGIGLAGLLIADGDLVGTLTDGSIHKLGRVVGRDGEKGADGIGIQGAPGLNGKDGTLENLKAEFDGERTISLRFKDTGELVEGGVIKLVGLTIFRGVWSSERFYETGDQALRDGSTWTAKADCIGRQPGTTDGAAFWQLSSKRGNDGKPGTKGLDGKDGKTGPPGRDGRAY